MFNYCKHKLQYESETYENFIRNNVAFVNGIDNILQKTQRKINHRNAKIKISVANVSNVIKSKLDTMILLLDKLNKNNNVITSLINKYRYESKLQCDRNKKYLKNKKKHKNTFIKKANRIDKPKGKRGRPRKTILINMQQTKQYSCKNEDYNDTENENILDFLYCYNFNQNISFD